MGHRLYQPSNIAPDNGQPVSKLVLRLDTSGTPVAVYDSLRAISADAGGGETTLDGAIKYLERKSLINVASAGGIVGVNTFPQNITLYDPATFNYQKIVADAAVTGGPEKITFSQRQVEMDHNFPDGTTIVAGAGPFEDVYAIDLVGVCVTCVALFVVFSNADPAALTFATLGAFDALHVEGFGVTPTITEIQARNVILPRAAMPCRYVSLLGNANLDGFGGGATDNLTLTLHRMSGLSQLGIF